VIPHTRSHLVSCAHYNVFRQAASNFYLNLVFSLQMIPSWFVQKHGDKFHQTVVLRSGISTKPCRVHLTVVYTPAHVPEIKLGRGWRDFARYNKLVVGDSLIFELRGISEFAVHIFRGNGNPDAVSSSTVSKKCSIDSELSKENGNDDSSAGCSSHQHLVAQGSGGSAGGLSELRIAKREIGEEGADVSVSRSTLQNSSCINLHQVSELVSHSIKIHHLFLR
jgi:hypothetical protein